jgi:prophage regulatory protein
MDTRKERDASTEAVCTTLSLLRLPRVKERVGFGKSQIYKLIRRGEFPAPARIGKRSVAWSAQAIDAWIRERIAAGAGK